MMTKIKKFFIDEDGTINGYNTVYFIMLLIPLFIQVGKLFGYTYHGDVNVLVETIKYVFSVAGLIGVVGNSQGIVDLKLKGVDAKNVEIKKED